MTDYTGKDLYLAFKGTAINTEFRDYSTSEEIGTVDVSAGADAARTYVVTLEDGTASLTLLDQTGGTAATDAWNLLDKGAQGTLEWGPEGTASTKPRHYVNAIVTNRSRSFPYAEAVQIDIAFQFSGATTDTSYA